MKFVESLMTNKLTEQTSLTTPDQEYKLQKASSEKSLDKLQQTEKNSNSKLWGGERFRYPEFY